VRAEGCEVALQLLLVPLHHRSRRDALLVTHLPRTLRQRVVALRAAFNTPRATPQTT
jgi:hypothetical protein